MRKLICTLLFLMAATLASSSLYAGASKTPSKPTPDTISAISADSITVQHTKLKAPTAPKKEKPEVTTKTYKITTTTEIDLNGEISKVDNLKKGMAVVVDFESPSGSLSSEFAGVATRIAAKTDTTN